MAPIPLPQQAISFCSSGSSCAGRQLRPELVKHNIHELAEPGQAAIDAGHLEAEEEARRMGGRKGHGRRSAGRSTLSTGGSVVNVESFSISTGRGNDLIRTSAGNDNLYGGDGNDSLYGRAGYDYLYGQAGNYLIELGNGEGYDYGNGGYADGGAGDDQLLGGDASDNLQGGDGNDLLTGGMNSDWLTGGDGNDIFYYQNPNEGGDHITDLNGGFDRIQVSAAGFGGGLVAGMDLLASGRYVENSTGLATSAAGIGQFIYFADYNQLYWDGDGAGGLSASPLSTFAFDPVNWSASGLQVV